MALFFRSQTCRAIDIGDHEIRFEITGSFAGLPRGAYCAEDETEQYVLRMFSAEPSSGIEEITQKQWEADVRRSYSPPPPPAIDPVNRIGKIASEPFVSGSVELPRNQACAIRSDRSTVVQLGRAGDLINVLPCTRALARANPSGKTRVVVGRNYAPILDGCSYVEPVVFDGDINLDYLKAAEWSQKEFGGHQLQTQVYFSGAVHGRQTPSFCLDNWLKAGFSPQWWDELPLVFDKRDAMRETMLLRGFQSRKPLLLYNVTGISSRYPHREKLVAFLEGFSAEFKLVNIGEIVAEKFFDVLALMDAAAGMITIDTATLHLANAARCPYIALITDYPTAWHGSMPKGNCVMQLRYDESESKFDRIGKAIEAFSEPMICHLWTSPRQLEAETYRRHSLAAQTWKRQGWVERKIGEYAVDRVFVCGDRLLPYVKDLIDSAVEKVRENDLIVLTNADICCAARLSREVRSSLKSGDCLWSNRKDFKRIDATLKDDQIASGHPYPGTDLFAFKASWWKRRRGMMPDMVYGAEGWDLCLRVLMQEDGGKELRDVTYHERHDSFWERHENRFSIKSQIHNRALARAFCALRGHDPKPHGL